MKRLVAGFILGALVALPMVGSTHPGNHNHIAVYGRFPCQEDEILKGMGDFNGVRWSRGWACAHPDNLR